MSEVIFTAPASGLYSYNEEIFFELSNGDKYVGLPKIHLDALRVRVDELEKENQKLKEALSVASAEIKALKSKLEEHNKFFREILFTEEGEKIVGVSRNGAIKAYNRNIYVARKLLYGQPYPENT